MGNVFDGMAQVDHVTDKTTETGSTQGGTIKFAASGMKGLRDTMEDCHTICSEIPVGGSKTTTLKGHSLFAVYDGHGGGFTSQFAGKNFVRCLSERKELIQYAALPRAGNESQEDVNGVELLRKALTATFAALDEELRNMQIFQNETLLRRLSSGANEDMSPEAMANARPERSGSTIVVVILTPSHFICANAGDSRAILRQGTRVLPLSFDHKPSNVAELERIVDAGGFVRGKRVDGDLAVSRGLGDFFFKSDEGLTPQKQKVIVEPDFMVYPRDHAKDEFIVLACDGVWDVVTNEDCSAMIRELIDEGETDLGLICEEVLDTCLEKQSRDNMTIVMVALPQANLSREMSLSTGPVWSRRAARKARSLDVQARNCASSATMGFGLNNCDIASSATAGFGLNYCDMSSWSSSRPDPKRTPILVAAA